MEDTAVQREVMEFDVVIVGAGPAGLSASIRLAQLSNEQNLGLNICVVEKGSEVGAHILSGAVMEPANLTELLPNWKELGAPLHTPVASDKFMFLTAKKAFRLPTPPQMNNHGNYIISLGNLCRFLAEQATNLGVQIFPGFPAADILYDDNGRVAGILTGEFGIGKDGEKKESYQAPMELRAKYTLLGEGCRGHLTKRLEKKFDLRKDVQPQTYGIGLKELWRIKPENHKQGSVTHTAGWPLKNDVYGGSFIYHMEDNLVSIGYVIGLDYANPYLNPFKEFQKFKTHPHVAKVLEGGERISYGARAINEGGLQSIPKLSFPGGALLGCAAGMVNVPKIKGSHNAIKSGILAAESIVEALPQNAELENYEQKFKDSSIYKELYKVRNIRPSFKRGFILGFIYSAIDTVLFFGKAPWTFKHHKDNEATKKASGYKPIEYPRPDGKLTFDLLSSVFISGTNHEEDQPAHLKLVNYQVMIDTNYDQYASPETRYCPAGVYEIVMEAENKPRLQINAQNCLHCKTCDIKDITQNINWVTPEGGGGPNYPNM